MFYDLNNKRYFPGIPVHSESELEENLSNSGFFNRVLFRNELGGGHSEGESLLTANIT